MKRHAQPTRRHFMARQEQPVLPKILEAVSLITKLGEHCRKTRTREQLQRKEVMALEAGIIVRPIQPVDAPEWQERAPLPSGMVHSSRQTRTSLPTCEGSRRKVSRPVSTVSVWVRGPLRAR